MNNQTKAIPQLIAQRFDLDLRNEKEEDYPDGYLIYLKQLDKKNHRIFTIPDDRFGDRLPSGYKVLGRLEEDRNNLTGKVAFSLTSGLEDYGCVASNTRGQKAFILLDERKDIGPRKYYFKDIVAVYRLETIVSGRLIDIDPVN